MTLTALLIALVESFARLGVHAAVPCMQRGLASTGARLRTWVSDSDVCDGQKESVTLRKQHINTRFLHLQTEAIATNLDRQ